MPNDLLSKKEPMSDKEQTRIMAKFMIHFKVAIEQLNRVQGYNKQFLKLITNKAIIEGNKVVLETERRIASAQYENMQDTAGIYHNMIFQFEKCDNQELIVQMITAYNEGNLKLE